MSEVQTVKVGDIFVRSWGYDQTNVNFYEVVRVTPSGKTLKLCEVGRMYAEDGQHVTPIPGAYKEDYCARCGNHVAHHNNGTVTSHAFTSVFTKRLAKGWSGAPYLNWNSYSGASLWDGKPEYVTGFGGGH